MTLTANEIRLAAHAYALRHDEADTEFWFAPEPMYFGEPARLWARGYLDRKWQDSSEGRDLVYRFSDKAMTAQMLISSIVEVLDPN